MRLYCLLPILTLIIISCPGTTSFVIARIINGDAVDIKDFPFIVSLQKRKVPKGNDYRHFCGGNIISKDTVLTAAHCLVKDLKNAQWMWIVRAGSTFRDKHIESHQVKNATLHPNYNPLDFNYDFALLFIKDEFRFQNGVQMICIATPEYNIGVKDELSVSGWGVTEFSSTGTNNLQSANVNIVNQTVCVENYKFVNAVTDTMICAGAIDPNGTVRDGCAGDSGGPLVHEGVLAGIVSWGFKCGLPNFPGVYSRVSVAYDWITENVKTFY